MNYALQHLAHLVQVKNDLNRKRRRFYYIANPRDHIKLEYTSSGPCYRHTKGQVHYAYSKMEAIEGYENAKREMKAMTPLMREVRLSTGARLCWTDGGSICAIECGDEKYYLPEIARMADLYKADHILLGD
jgi:hypothetical protein